ncbi:MAG: ABC transporter substrate-binding protein [Armatimonadota bacterium]
MTRREFVAGAAALAASGSLLRFAVPASGAPAPSPAQAPARPSTGGVLRTTLGAEPTTLDPHQSRTLFDFDVKDALFDGLLDDDFTEGPRGALAESWESPDASTYVFRLRRGLRFHDGSPITADAVKSTAERIQGPDGLGQTRSIVEQIASTDVLDPQSIRFRLKGPNAAFLMDIADMKIVPRNFDARNPVGSGPFQFVEWVRLRHVRLKKFPGYWLAGRPYLDELVFMPTPDENQKIVLLETGGVEFTDTVPLPRVQDVERGGKIVVHSIPPGVSPSSYYMLTRADRPPLNNAKVRQAMNFAIDRKALLQVTFGKGTLKSNAIPPKHWAFNPESVSFNERDVSRARKLMSEAGQGSGFSLQLKHLTSRAEFFTLAQVFQANMAEIGIKIDLIPQEIGIWVNQVLVQRDFQLGLTGVIPRYDPDAMLGEQFSGKRVNGRAIGWRHDLFEKQLEQGRANVGQEARKRVYYHAQLIAQWEAPGFILNERPILYGAAPSVQGFKPDIRQHTHFVDVWLKR